MSKGAKVISQVPEVALLILLILTVTDMFISVVTRYIWGKAIFWAEEVGTFGLVWMTMIGAGVAVKKTAHFTMPTFIGRLPSRVQLAASLLNQALIIVIGVVLIVTGIEITRASSEMASPALEVSLGIINSAAIVGGVMVLLYAGWQLKGIIARGSASSKEGQ